MVKVIKFGGTSLKNEKSRHHVLHLIQEMIPQEKIVVVVSAMGRLKDPYATDTLASLVGQTLVKEEKDKLLGCGEIISSVVLCDTLNKAGIKAKTLTSYECGLASKRFQGHDLLYDLNVDKIHQAFLEADVVILPGFQGVDKEGKIVTLERGGSDYSAVFIAHQLGLDEVSLYSDVCGIYTADPKYVIHSRLIAHISYQQALDLAHHKARIICEEALHEAKTHQMKIYLKSTFMKDCFTLIDHETSHVKTMGIDFDYYLLDKDVYQDDEEIFETEIGYMAKKKDSNVDSKDKFVKVHLVGCALDHEDIQTFFEEIYPIKNEKGSYFIRDEHALHTVNLLHDDMILEE